MANAEPTQSTKSAKPMYLPGPAFNPGGLHNLSFDSERWTQPEGTHTPAPNQVTPTYPASCPHHPHHTAQFPSSPPLYFLSSISLVSLISLVSPERRGLRASCWRRRWAWEGGRGTCRKARATERTAAGSIACPAAEGGGGHDHDRRSQRLRPQLLLLLLLLWLRLQLPRKEPP